MSEVLYALVRIVAKIHNYIMHLNDAFELFFSDKEMHFIIIGLLGMGMLFVIYPLFKWLAEKKHVMIISWIYVFTLVIVITFAIEIGQKISNTGNMEFDDIMFGVIGFIVMFAIFSVFRSLYHMIMMFIKAKLGQENVTEKAQEEETEHDGKVVEADNIYEDIKNNSINVKVLVPAPKELYENSKVQTGYEDIAEPADIDTNLIAQAYEEQISDAKKEDV